MKVYSRDSIFLWPLGYQIQCWLRFPCETLSWTGFVVFRYHCAIIWFWLIPRFFDEDSFHPPTPTSDSANPAALNTIERDSPEEGKHEPIVNKSYVIPRSGAETKDVSCQTDIHISPRFNFDKYFADYQTQVRLKAFRESAGSVRRRLFTDIEEEMEPWERSLSAVPSFSQKMNESLGFDFEPVELCSGLDDSSTQDENAPCSSIY